MRPRHLLLLLPLLLTGCGLPFLHRHARGLPAAQPTATLAATPLAIHARGEAELKWTVTQATTITITGVGFVPPQGSAVVYPTVTTTYVLTATSAGGTASASTTVIVQP